jgi:sulfite exporter TauE/SafE
VAPVAMTFGLLFIFLGLGYFVGTGSEHLTALIPTFLGFVVLILGLLARKDRLRKHAMHAAAALGLLGFLGGAYRGFPGLVAMLSGTEIERPAAAIESSLMAVGCLVFVLLCVKSFIDARRRRTQQPADPVSPI